MVSRAKKALKWVDTIKTGSRALLGKDLSRAVSSRATGAVLAAPASYAKGGVVRKTGMAKVHKGEMVLTAAKHRALKKLLA